MHRKKTRKKFPIQGNFYPMTSMAFIETDINRVTLISSETHGVASLSPGITTYWLSLAGVKFHSQEKNLCNYFAYLLFPDDNHISITLSLQGSGGLLS